MEPSKRKSIPLALRKAVWEAFKTPENLVACRHCSAKIDAFSFECGHVQSVAKGGSTTFDNLVPVCGPCNRSVGTRNINVFNTQYLQAPNNGSYTQVDPPEPSETTGKCNYYGCSRPCAKKIRGQGLGKKCALHRDNQRGYAKHSRSTNRIAQNV
jgi:hypothetical protein